MLDDKILNRTRRLIEVRFAKRQKVLPEQVYRILRSLKKAGMLDSSPGRNRVRAACEQEVRIKAEIVWDSIQKAHKALGSPISNTLATDLKEEAGHSIEDIVKEISTVLTRPPVTRLFQESGYLVLEDIKREVGKKIDVEVDLYVDLLTQEPAGEGQKSKYTPEKIKNMETTYNKHLKEKNDVKYAWNCVAEEHSIKSAKAAEMAVRRYRKKNK
ncbi:hypothetical protein ACFL1G_01730 [Planctomycetota bacterium]